jgi:hypothetical protein
MQMKQNISISQARLKTAGQCQNIKSTLSLQIKKIRSFKNLLRFRPATWNCFEETEKPAKKRRMGLSLPPAGEKANAEPENPVEGLDRRCSKKHSYEAD